MFLSLPDGCGVLFGMGNARFIFTSPIPVKKTVEAITPINASCNVAIDEDEGSVGMVEDLVNVD
jgi:hypothetical protein